MKNKRNLLYIDANIEINEFVYTGIEFAEFFKFLTNPIKNLMLISGGNSVLFLESNFERGFELLEGQKLMNKLTRYDIYSMGDFCFVDYVAHSDPENLKEEQIAELLYLGHMFKPLHSPFFDKLGNRFAYLAHDDGFFCKLYCRNIADFADVLCGKIQSFFSEKTNPRAEKPDKLIIHKLLNLATKGILIDFNDLVFNDSGSLVKVYLVGKYTNMDSVMNNSYAIKENALNRYMLAYSQNKWTLT